MDNSFLKNIIRDEVCHILLMFVMNSQNLLVFVSQVVPNENNEESRKCR